MHIWALFFLISLSYNPGTEPHIVTQHAERDGSKSLNIHNPLDQAVWIYIECSNVISVHPIGVPPRHWSDVNLKSNDPNVPVDDNTCYINHWQIAKNGNVP